MHYNAKAFAINPSVPTIITPNGYSIGQRYGLSEVIYSYWYLIIPNLNLILIPQTDVYKLSSLYNCWG